jgi:hypothetical protein
VAKPFELEEGSIVGMLTRISPTIVKLWEWSVRWVRN